MENDRIVVKLGTGILTKDIGILDILRIRSFCQVVSDLKKRGKKVVIVSSGAVGLGMGKLEIPERPKNLSSLQKCAAVGQSLLMETWQTGLGVHHIVTAQVLLTREDIQDEQRCASLCELMEGLLSDGIVPIVNENDCISAEEIKFGDNDLLAALLSERICANILFILSTVSGLLDLRTNTLISEVPRITPEIEALACGSPNTTSVGGMLSKIKAAKIVKSAGIPLFIGSGENPEILLDFFNDKAQGTYFPT